MSLPRIELADPTDEGRAIAEALRKRGHVVVERSVESLTGGSDAALVLLAGDDPATVDALTALLARETSAPIILLGQPDDSEHAQVTSVRPLGADAYYARPIAIERLVRKVETFLSPPETHLAPLSDEAEGAAAPPPKTLVPSDVPTPTREPTIVQDEGDDRWSDDASSDPQHIDRLFEEEDAEVSGIAEVTGISFRDDIASIEEALAAHDPEAPISQIARRLESRPPPENVAVLSPRLTKIFSEADRRVFPDSSPLDLDLPDRQEPARELVPDELLEVVAVSAETREEDPLEAFTYVGVVPPELVGAPLPMPEAGQRYQPHAMTGEQRLPPARPARTAAEVSRPSRPPPTFAADSAVDAEPSAERSSVVEPTRDEPTEDALSQSGSVDGPDVLRFLMSLADAAAPIDASLSLEDGSVIEISLDRGGLVRIVANVHVHAVRDLHRHGRVDEAPADEARAVALLDARVSAGTIGRFEADRALRRARESRLHDLAATSSLAFDVEPSRLHGKRDPGLLGSPFASVLAEGVRRRVDAPRLRALFGGGDLVLTVNEGLGPLAGTLGFEPEIAQAVERHDRASVENFLRAAPADEGLAGVLFALWAVRAIDVKNRDADHTGMVDPTHAVRALIESAHGLAEEGCYFDVLGVDPTALPRELRAAYEKRRDELAGVDLEAHGLEALAAHKREALEVVDEAFEILSDEGLRIAYRRSLRL
jgi:hypothetical protein